MGGDLDVEMNRSTLQEEAMESADSFLDCRRRTAARTRTQDNERDIMTLFNPLDALFP